MVVGGDPPIGGSMSVVEEEQAARTAVVAAKVVVEQKLLKVEEALAEANQAVATRDALIFDLRAKVAPITKLEERAQEQSARANLAENALANVTAERDKFRAVADAATAELADVKQRLAAGEANHARAEKLLGHFQAHAAAAAAIASF